MWLVCGDGGSQGPLHEGCASVCDRLFLQVCSYQFLPRVLVPILPNGVWGGEALSPPSGPLRVLSQHSIHPLGRQWLQTLASQYIKSQLAQAGPGI